MKQPELGQKILELRKAKGLTQEELVDRCNINVRTIQRIEAGEVTPRMFTIKTILESLGYDLNTIQFQETPEEQPRIISLKPDDRLLKSAFILGIAYFVLAFVESFVDMAVWGMYPLLSFHDSIPFPVYLFLKVLVFFTFTGFMIGFYRITLQHPNTLIKVSAIILAGLSLVTAAVDSYSFYVERAHIFFLPMESVAFGMVYMLFGMGLLKYRKTFGELAFFGGLLCMTSGFCFLTVILAVPGLILLVLVEILMLVLLYRAFERSPNKLVLV
ncbi:MAG TPA: helix-turn-helix transcriptional regulator [Ohtaekwangia sp.]